jgi:long-chain fatty acid transport protein
MKKQTFFLPHAYGSYALDNGLTFGVGFYAPYGLGTEWPSTYSGRYLAVKTDLKSFYFNPSVAYKVNDKFSIGIGGSYVWSKVTLNRKVQLVRPGIPPTVLPDGSIDLDGTGHGFDFSAGILTKPTPELSIGASYRHSVKIDYTGNAVFSNMGSYASLFPGGVGKTRITFPNNIFVGVGLQPTTNLTLEMDFQYIEWSKYDTLKIDMPVGPTAPAPISRPLQGPSSSPKNWDNTFIIRLGGEYQLDKLALRAGYIFDKSPQPDQAVEPMLPDADRNEITAGLGYELSKEISIDVAYQIIFFHDRTVGLPANTFPGLYKATAHLFGLSLGYTM